MQDLNDILVFASVVEQNGFSAAARLLNLPKSSVSRRVARLEARLGMRLLERSTRRVRLTEAGRAYYARCKASLDDLESAEKDIARLRADPIGIIRVSCPTGLTQFSLARVIPEFLTRYPLVRIQVIATNRVIDLVHDKIDVAIRARLHLEDEAVTMHKLGRSRHIFVASPLFLRSHDVPGDPHDASTLPFLSFREDEARPRWKLIGPGAVTKIVAFEPILWTSDFNVILESAYAGRGFALLPSEVVGSAIERKRLVRVFPAWHSEEVTIHLVFTKKQGLTPAVRVFIDFLAEHFRFRNEDYHPHRRKSGKRRRG
jgi:DNA-binding transcriptional LysR family regulator